MPVVAAAEVVVVEERLGRWPNGRDGSGSDGLVSQDEAHAGLDDDSFVTGGQRGRWRSGSSILLVGRMG
jgi:hypothetical protein